MLTAVMFHPFIARFENNAKFNQPLGSWDVSRVTMMKFMFKGAHYFNQDISGWDTSRVNDMSEMFYRAKRFNQAIQSWDISKVKLMSGMFGLAKSFDQNLCEWNDPTMPSADRGGMFDGSGCPNQAEPAVDDEGRWSPLCHVCP